MYNYTHMESRNKLILCCLLVNDILSTSELYIIISEEMKEEKYNISFVCFEFFTVGEISSQKIFTLVYNLCIISIE